MTEIAVIRSALLRDIARLRTMQGYVQAGIPHFRALFGRDSLIVSWQLLHRDASVARHTLVKLASLQGRRTNLKKEEEPGKILHQYYEPWQLYERFIHVPWITFGWGLPYYGSVDATSLWLIVLFQYVQKSGDRALLNLLWPNALRAASWLSEYADHNDDGFIDYEPHNPLALVHQGWKDSTDLGSTAFPIAPVEVQGYTFAAWRAVAELATMVGDREETRRADQHARILKQKFSSAFELSDGFFAYGLDGKGEKILWATSNPGHLLFSGMLDNDQSEHVIGRLFSDEFWTPYGIRTLSTKDPAFDWQTYHRGSVWPHDNWFFWMGLKRLGRHAEATRVRNALIRAWEVLGGKITELYAVHPDSHEISLTIYIEGHNRIQQSCWPQAWASGALLMMLDGA